MKNALLITLLALAMMACGSTKSSDTGNAGTLDNYLAIKDALVATNAAKASQAAKAFLEVNTNASLKTSLQMIANTTDVNAQRQAFEELSKEMYFFVKAENPGVTIYKQYCPMAFNNKGAYWLAKEEQVNNPYFGDRMLHCGSVQETISQ